MKTLVVHPDDRSTDFLKTIYEGKGFTVINKWHPSYNEIKELVETHDRIMFMGHGAPYGLFGYTEHLMNPDFIKLLETKMCVCIWCNADKYIEKTNLSGFYTGMFISEVSEASYFGIEVSQEEINYSNNLFARVMSELIEYPLILEEVKEYYSGADPVIRYNNSRLYYREKK